MNHRTAVAALVVAWFALTGCAGAPPARVARPPLGASTTVTAPPVTTTPAPRGTSPAVAMPTRTTARTATERAVTKRTSRPATPRTTAKRTTAKPKTTVRTTTRKPKKPREKTSGETQYDYFERGLMPCPPGETTLYGRDCQH